MELSKVSSLGIDRSSSLLSPTVVGHWPVVIISLVLFEDFLRMISPFGGGGWLLLKDLLLLMLYSLFAIEMFASSPRSISIPWISGPLVAYFFATCLIYLYSVIGHDGYFGPVIIGARVDLFYVPLVFALLYASRWSRFPNIYFSLFAWVVVFNCASAWIQFSFPWILDGVPGFSGIRKEVTMLIK